MPDARQVDKCLLLTEIGLGCEVYRLRNNIKGTQKECMIATPTQLIPSLFTQQEQTVQTSSRQIGS